MAYKFLCDHCGKKFELEAPEAKECPSCFWSSSVKREDEAALEKKGGARVSSEVLSRSGRPLFAGILRHLFRVLVFIFILIVTGFLAYKIYVIFASPSSPGWKTFSIKIPHEVKPSEKPASDPLAVLSQQEKEALSHEAVIPTDRVPDATEQGILGRSVAFQTGWIEKLPSPVWTLEQYEKMIADQEAFYKMPFARSYKKKLTELFKAKYVAAADMFTKGNVLAARDLWVESLAFPLYSTDLKKHRAVALTMLRPFINDTLSKISAMNQSILDKGKKAKEQALGEEYQQLMGLIAQKKWQEALTLVDSMSLEVEQLRKHGVPQEAPPSYPPAFGTIDVDLQRPLMDLMSPRPSSTADLQPLQQDLVEKKEVIETFTEAYLKNAMTIYQTALGLIRDKKWLEAIRELESIQGPQELQQDAAGKIAILEKIAGRTLASPEKTS